MVLKTNSVDTDAAAQAEMKKRAARQAAKREAIPVNHELVECVVLPQGDGQISMGQHFAGLGEAHYEEGEKFQVQLPTAIALYRRGYVNFDGARQAMEKDNEERRHEKLAALREKQLQDKALDGHL